MPEEDRLGKPHCIDRNDMAKLLAAHADAVLVSAHPGASEVAAKIKAELIEAGAKEVIFVDAAPADLASERQDVA